MIILVVNRWWVVASIVTLLPIAFFSYCCFIGGNRNKDLDKFDIG